MNTDHDDFIKDWMQQGTMIEDNRITLERIPLQVEQMVSNTLMENALYGVQGVKIERVTGIMSDRFAYQLRAYVLGERQEEFTIEYPADWWQAFKERWFPESCKRRWPVEYKRYEFKRFNIYPKMKYQVPDDMGAAIGLMLWN